MQRNHVVGLALAAIAISSAPAAALGQVAGSSVKPTAGVDAAPREVAAVGGSRAAGVADAVGGTLADSGAGEDQRVTLPSPCDLDESLCGGEDVPPDNPPPQDPPAKQCRWVASTGNAGGLFSPITSASAGVALIVTDNLDNHRYFAPPPWSQISAGQRLGFYNGGGGPVVAEGKRGYARFYQNGPFSDYEREYLQVARDLIEAFDCAAGDEWFWTSGYSTQASYCSCP